MAYVLVHTCDGDNLHPEIYLTKNDAIRSLKDKIVEIIKTNWANEWIFEELPTDNEGRIDINKTIKLAIDSGHVTKISELKYECFDFETLEIIQVNAGNRLEDLLISAYEWTINVSEQETYDIIHATGITSDELEEIGYDKSNFPSMHRWAEGEYV